MKKALMIFILFTVLGSFSLDAFFTDVMNVLKFMTKISKQISDYSDNFEHHYEEFHKYYNKYWKNFNRKFFKREIKLLKSEDTSFTIKKPYIDIESDAEIWRDIFRDPIQLTKKYKYISYIKHLKDNEYYRKNRNYRNFINKNINEQNNFIKEISNFLNLLAETRKMQKLRGEKVKKIKKINDLAGRPEAYWEAKRVKLFSIGAMLDFEIQQQIVELILLVNGQTELELKGKVISENLFNFSKKVRNDISIIKE
ncbi:MAG: hypothetical protein ABFR75_05575 [Acidobacteriota bacterium]